jgi:hypothetical protein
MMRINEALSTFDEYTRRARVYPGLLAVLPIIVFSAALLGAKPLIALTPILLSGGMLFLLVNVVRSFGKKAEVRLIRRWDGLPTTKMLRHREASNRVLFDRRRSAVSAIFDTPLPSRRQEAANPTHADELYVAATRCVIAHLRARSTDLPLLAHENMSYGYARNMFGLKPLALAILAGCLVADAVVLKRNGLSSALVVVAATHGVLTIIWLSFVRSGWVQQAAKTYAERLFEALDQPQRPQPDTQSNARLGNPDG